MNPTTLIAACIGALVLLLAGCGGSDDRRTVLVFAAASLSEAFTEIATEYEAAHPGVDIELNIAGSSSLREQIRSGAPADVIASANEAVMADLVDAGDVGTPVVFATNRLALAVPSGNPAGVTHLGDLARSELLVGLCAAGVPCGDLARSALAAAGIEPSVDTNESDVRALRTRLAEGELDVGLVYVTDTRSEPDVLMIVVDGLTEHAARYPIATIDDANADAQDFVDFVTADTTARAVLTDHGFGLP